MFKNQMELIGQFLVLASLLIQIFVLDVFKEHQRNAFEYQVKESLYYLSLGMDRVDTNFIQEKSEILNWLNSWEYKTTSQNVSRLVIRSKDQKDPWETEIFISTLITTLIFLIGSGLILYDKHFNSR